MDVEPNVRITGNENQMTTEAEASALPAVDEAAVQEAEAAKDQANAAFKAKKFGEAIDGYTAAIAKNPNNCVYFSNRAFSHIKLENYGAAITDATKSIELNPDYVKGYYRRCANRMHVNVVASTPAL